MSTFVPRAALLLVLVLMSVTGCGGSSPTTANPAPVSPGGPAAGPDKTKPVAPSGRQPDAPKHIGEN